MSNDNEENDSVVELPPPEPTAGWLKRRYSAPMFYCLVGFVAVSVLSDIWLFVTVPADTTIFVAFSGRGRHHVGLAGALIPTIAMVLLNLNLTRALRIESMKSRRQFVGHLVPICLINITLLGCQIILARGYLDSAGIAL